MRRLLFSTVGLVLASYLVAHAGPPTTQPTESSPTTAPAGVPIVAPLVTVQAGTLPIILVAPHGGTEVIPGAPVRKNDEAAKFVTGGDARTAELCVGIADGLEKQLGGRPYVVIARFQRRFADANRAAKDAYESDIAGAQWAAYHAAIRAACDDVALKFGRGILLDIHGQKLTADAIYRGTRNGAGVRSLIAEQGIAAVVGPDSIFGALHAEGYKTLPEPGADTIGKEADYSGNYTIVAYGSDKQPKIDAIQIEFGNELRGQKKLDKTAEDAAAAIATFSRRYLPANPLVK